MALPNPITAGQTDANSPLNQILMDSIRLNLDDLESRITALESTFTYSVGGSNVTVASSPQVVVTLTSIMMLKTFRMRGSGTVSVVFQFRSSDPSLSVNARIYKNGSPIGTARSTDQTSYQTPAAESVSFVDGDSIELWGDKGAATSLSVKNFRLLAQEIPKDIIDELDGSL